MKTSMKNLGHSEEELSEAYQRIAAAAAAEANSAQVKPVRLVSLSAADFSNFSFFAGLLAPFLWTHTHAADALNWQRNGFCLLVNLQVENEES